MTENPFSTQGWNRYSYVGNSPVNFTDPSGYCFMGCFWQPVFRAIGNFFRQSWRALAQLGVTTLLCAGAGPFAPVCAGAVAFAVTGVTSGDLGLAMRAGITAFATAFAFKVVGDLTGGFPGAPNGGHAPLIAGSEAHIFNIAGHALVGCASALAQGSRCGPGALAAGVTSLAGPWINGRGFSVRGLVANAVLGGVASVAGGGRFANGATTAAFGYLFNATLQLGVTIEVPGFVAKGISYAYRWLSGDDTSMWANLHSGMSFGLVYQYADPSEAGITRDFGVYVQSSHEALGYTGLKAGVTADLVTGRGTIDGTLEGRAHTVGVGAGIDGITVTTTDPDPISGTVTGLGFRAGPQLGGSWNITHTGTVTIGDALGWKKQ